VPVNVNDERCTMLPDIDSEPYVVPSVNEQPSVMPGVIEKLTIPTLVFPEIALPLADIDPSPTLAHPLVRF
jgi:hypothetical protein